MVYRHKKAGHYNTQVLLWVMIKSNVSVKYATNDNFTGNGECQIDIA
jgi:hypothetical protein